jgi:hypothetical protein
MRKAINQVRLRQWAATGGACCFLAGILAPVLGMLLTASGWIFGVAVHPWIHLAGTALLIVAIPLILFAGFCLDWAEREQKKAAHDAKGAQRGNSALSQVAFVATILGEAPAGPRSAQPATDHLQHSQHRGVRTWLTR